MEAYRALIEERIERWCDGLPHTGLYAPMAYLMRLPGKRVRPMLTLLGCELFGGRAAMALEEAVGIEVFHNFTLMHDDIMDGAPLRRGQPTVHVKWDANTAVLSGDAMLVKAYALMSAHPTVLAIFSQHALEVCEGQQLDMEFEQRTVVDVADYMEMIRLKTAVLLACALKCGAGIAGAPAADQERLGSFGEQLGLAFQLRDDLLDAFGDPALTGKQRGGDLRAGKKTYLLIRGLQREAEEGTDVLARALAEPARSRDVDAMLVALERTGVRGEAERRIAAHEQAAMEALAGIDVAQQSKQPLLQLAAALGARAH